MDKLILDEEFNVLSVEMVTLLTELIYKLRFQKLINLWALVPSLLGKEVVFMLVG
jgi:hypothetical protein